MCGGSGCAAAGHDTWPRSAEACQARIAALSPTQQALIEEGKIRYIGLSEVSAAQCGACGGGLGTD